VVIGLGALVLSTGPLFRIRSWFTYHDPLSADAAVIAVQILPMVAGGIALVTGRRWRRLPPIPTAMLLALVAWMAIGAWWSLDGTVTLRESLLVGGTLVAGAGAGVVGSLVELAWGLWFGIQFGLAWSLIAIWQVRPGTQDAFHAWVGVFVNRNSLGLVAGLAVVTTVMLVVGGGGWSTSHRSRLLIDAMLVAGAGFDLVLLARSRSATPMVAIVAAAVALVATTALHGRLTRAAAVRLSVVVAVVFTALLALAVAFRSQLAGLVGRDSTFSGREGLWRTSWEWFSRRPLIGQGYLSAWTDPAFINEIWVKGGLAFDSAHNSFVEVLLGCGVVGFVLFAAAVLLVHVGVSVRALLGGWWDRLPLALFAFVLVEHLAETLLIGAHLTVAILGALLVTGVAVPARGTDAGAQRREQPDRAAPEEPLSPYAAAAPTATDLR
jgi:exopolysaccharide production protein ExoQ